MANPSKSPLFNASGAVRALRAGPLFAIGPAAPGPALRRGFLVAIPVGAALLVELGLGAPTKGGIATGAMFAGFTGLDAPARIRAAWQAAVAPAIGMAAALGALTGGSAPLAIATMALIGAAAGYCYAVSLRLSIYGLSTALTLLVAQGLPLSPSDALPALLYATAGGLLQVAFSLCVYAAGDRTEEGERPLGARPRPSPRCAPTRPCARPASATRSASAPRSPSASPPTGCWGWKNTASGCR